MEWIKANLPETDGYTVVWQSQPKGILKIGVWPVLFGVRVIAWREGSFGRSVDYCAGSDETFLVELLYTIKAILSKCPEDVSEVQVESMMPPWEVRPISKDPACWSALQRLAHADSLQPPSQCATITG